MNERILCLTLTIAAALFSLTAPAALADGAQAEAADAAASGQTDGWVLQDDLWYYLVDGVRATGWQTIDGKRYYMQPDGHMSTGWTVVKDRTYYFDSSGDLYTGPRYIDGKMYLFSPVGVLQKGGSAVVSGREYPLGSDGVLEGYLNDTSGMAAHVLDEIGWDLRAAFDWASSLPYRDRDNRAPEGAVHSQWYAAYGFSYRFGNCYVMAAVFYQMARLLGCDVYYIEGGVGSYDGTVIDHSWTEMVIDGELYVFDPDFTREEGRDGYQIWYEKPGTWWYWQPVRVD